MFEKACEQDSEQVAKPPVVPTKVGTGSPSRPILSALAPHAGSKRHVWPRQSLGRLGEPVPTLVGTTATRPARNSSHALSESPLPRGLLLGIVLLVSLAFTGSVTAQEAEKPATVERAKIALSFLPPPLETATYSLGIYEAKTHKLVRHLYEFASEGAFTVGLNGLITSWDGKDDGGKPVPPGRYAARGYAVGALKVEGKAILGNDWAADNEGLRFSHVRDIAVVPEDNGLIVAGTTPLGQLQVARYGGEKCELLWQKLEAAPLEKAVDAPKITLAVLDQAVVVSVGSEHRWFQISDGNTPPPALDSVPVGRVATQSAGKNGTIWKIEEGVLGQYSAPGERLRSLAPREGEPEPIAVAASKTTDRLYLLEESKDMQRVRGLSWKENSKEGEKAVSTWSTFFENALHPAYVPVGPDNAPLTAQADIALVENPLSPGKPERLKLAAAFDAKGSYLATADGLRLRQISQRANLRAVKLARNKGAAGLLFYQGDGAAWDEFTIEGAREMMGFDAGDFELTATGEKPAEKPVEPDL